MDTNDFFTEAHPKLRPVESPTAGVFLSGACQGPKDIPETVAQAGAAAAKVIGLLCKDKPDQQPVRGPARDELMCNGCSSCEKVCPYGAITYIDKEFRRPDRTTLSPPRGPGQPGGLPGLRRLHGRLPVRRDGSQGLLEQTDHGGGGRDMQVSNRLEAHHRGFLLQLVLLRGRRPGRHQPAAAIRRTSRSSACPAPAA